MENGKMYGHICRVPGVCGGKLIIDGLRIRVQDVVICYEKQGMTPDAICDSFPPLTLGQVHAALAYFYDHRGEVEEEIAAGLKFAEEYRQKHPEQVR